MNLLGKMSQLYLNGILGWSILTLILIYFLTSEMLGLPVMLFFLFLFLILSFSIASFINLFLIFFTKDRNLKIYKYYLLSNVSFIIVVLLLFVFIFNVMSRL